MEFLDQLTFHITHSKHRHSNKLTDRLKLMVTVTELISKETSIRMTKFRNDFLRIRNCKNSGEIPMSTDPNSTPKLSNRQLLKVKKSLYLCWNKSRDLCSTEKC